jgi:hypothetical protein
MHGTTALERIVLRTLHQFLAKAMPSHGRGHGKPSNVKPSRLNISEQSAQYITVCVLENGVMSGVMSALRDNLHVH